MHGPVPKPAAIRQRRNRTSTAATLTTDEEQFAETPDLPKRRGRWHPLMADWWASIWESPMRDEWLRSDLYGLYRLAFLMNEFFRFLDPKLETAVEKLEAEFGLTPLARRRLQWEVQRVEAGEKKRPPQRPAASGADPRDVLRIVS